MKIAISGPPGSGKSKLAREIAQELDIKAVVGYTDLLQKNTDLALGPWATYSENMMIAGTRMGKECSAGPDYVVAGTIIDTLSYGMMKTDIPLRPGPLDTARVETLAEGAIKGLGVIYAETWDYDLSFFLPYTKTTRKRRDLWAQRLEAIYIDVYEAYGVPETPALLGSAKEKFTTAMEVILAYEKGLDEEAE